MTNGLQDARRSFLKAGGALGLAAATAAVAQVPGAPFLVTGSSDVLIPRGRQRRVVICGGGWGGLNAAKQLRLLAPDLEVVLLERNPVFFSCPMSNKWLVDVVDTHYLTHEYLAVSEKYGYRFVQTEILAVERDRKRVVTAAGHLDYDWLILSPGIRYNYEAW
ncbi:MAG: FAD-dependent oxidoreductase, partial [Rhodocyclaceae bacterium]|nr:FAD-dependent oxidoreductase [Rhodocyclaceae bacterium]